MPVPAHIKFLALNALGGVAIGCGAAGLILWADAGGLGTLIAETSAPGAALGLLFGGFSITFGSLAVGSAIMMMAEND